MNTIVHAFLAHLQIRVIATLKDPVASLVLLAAALSGLVFWPWTTTSTIMSSGVDEYDLVLWWMWVWLWPAVPMSFTAGRVTGKGLDTTFAARALPGLPVGLRTRAMAESAVVLSAVLIIRTLGCWLGDISPGGEYVKNVLLGAAIMAPALVAWGIPASTFGIFMLRPALVATALLFLQWLGVMSTMAGAVTASGLVLALLLWIAPREFAVPDPGKTRSLTARRFRHARNPTSMLRHDTWARPMRVWGVPVAIALVLMIGALVLDLRGTLPRWGLFATAEIVLIMVLIPLLRPFDSKLFGMSLVGRCGVRFGDELKAWAVLPVRPVSVVRCAWLHGLILAGGLWMVMMAMVVTRTWVRFGTPGLRAADGGDLTIILLPTVVLIPMVPGFLAAAVVGDRLRAGLSGGLILLAVHGNIMLFVALRVLFGRESALPVVVDALFLAAAMLIASIPPLRLLWSPRTAREEA